MSDKVFFITGATDGIGKAAATELVKTGSTLVLVGRNDPKTKALAEELGKDNHEVDFFVPDLSRLDEVRRLAEQFKAKYKRLDVLANNAGATVKEASKGPGEYEKTFTSNYLSPFLLTNLLLDVLKVAPGSRIISTSSSTQSIGNVDLEKISTDFNQAGWRAYANSKLADILFIKALTKRLEGTTTVANSFEPGMVKTSFGSFGSGEEADLGFFMNLVYRLAAPFALSPEQGADSLVWLVTAPEAGSLKGEYVSKRKPAKPQKAAFDTKLIDGLWELSEKLVQKK